MTRLALDELQTLIGTTIPDNVTGLISPEDVRQMLIDVMDSCSPSYALMWGDHSETPITKNLTGSWSVFLGSSLYSNADSSDVAELPTDPASGSMAIQYPDFAHSIRGTISLAGPANREMQFAVGHDGVPIGVPMSITLARTTKPSSVINAALFNARFGWNLQLMARLSDGGAAADVSVYGIYMEGSINPTHSAN